MKTCWRVYCTELATEEKTLFALLPTRRIVPTTITRITASITAYSAMSCPCSSCHRFSSRLRMEESPGRSLNLDGADHIVEQRTCDVGATSWVETDCPPWNVGLSSFMT